MIRGVCEACGLSEPIALREWFYLEQPGRRTRMFCTEECMLSTVPEGIGLVKKEGAEAAWIERMCEGFRRRDPHVEAVLESRANAVADAVLETKPRWCTKKPNPIEDLQEMIAREKELDEALSRPVHPEVKITEHWPAFAFKKEPASVIPIDRKKPK